MVENKSQYYDGTAWRYGNELITGRSGLAGNGLTGGGDAYAAGGATPTTVSCTEHYTFKDCFPLKVTIGSSTGTQVSGSAHFCIFRPMMFTIGLILCSPSYPSSPLYCGKNTIIINPSFHTIDNDSIFCPITPTNYITCSSYSNLNIVLLFQKRMEI